MHRTPLNGKELLQMKYKLITPLPILSLSDDKNVCIYVVGESIHIPQEGWVKIKDDSELEKIFSAENAEWVAIGHLLYKKIIDENYFLPLNEGAIIALEPFADLLFYTREMCIQSLTYYGSKQCPYENATHWFIEIVREIKRDIFQDIIALKNLGTRYTKTEVVNNLKKYVGILRSLDNPYDPEKMAHSYWLTEMCLSYLYEIPNFRNKIWIPFLNSYRRCYQSVESPHWGTINLLSSDRPISEKRMSKSRKEKEKKQPQKSRKAAISAGRGKGVIFLPALP